MRKMFARRIMWAKQVEESKVEEPVEVTPELIEVVEEVKEKKTRKKKTEE